LQPCLAVNMHSNDACGCQTAVQTQWLRPAAAVAVCLSQLLQLLVQLLAGGAAAGSWAATLLN